MRRRDLKPRCLELPPFMATGKKLRLFQLRRAALANPYFWFDFALTATLLALLPMTERAVGK